VSGHFWPKKYRHIRQDPTRNRRPADGQTPVFTENGGMNRPAVRAGGPPAPGWTLLAAPHRAFFAAGMAQVLLVMLLWAIELALRLAGRSSGYAIAPVDVHAWLMVYGVFPFFIFGFLFTVYPRWMAQAAIGRAAYARAAGLLTAGLIAVHAGWWLGGNALLTGLGLYLAGWGSAVLTLFGVFRRARAHGAHEPLLNAALVAGAVGIGCFMTGVYTGDRFWMVLARETGLWLFLVPVVFLVSHRMIPFFSQSVIMNYVMHRPGWAPPLLLVCAAGHALAELAGLPTWRFLADAPLAVAALHLSWRWQFRASFHARLLAMLHIAFLWLGLALLLYTGQSLAWLATGQDWLGRAPLHALGIGFLTSMIVAMASRVTLGHSGRSLVADRVTWFALLGVNAVALLRIAAELAPAEWTTTINLVSALAWLAVLGAWVAHYLPIYFRPRLDNRPG
jgi:uncharacterized protein involved in response to NO